MTTIENLRKLINDRLQKEANRESPQGRPPRYDDVYFGGLPCDSDSSDCLLNIENDKTSEHPE